MQNNITSLPAHLSQIEFTAMQSGRSAPPVQDRYKQQYSVLTCVRVKSQQLSSVVSGSNSLIAAALCIESLQSLLPAQGRQAGCRQPVTPCLPVTQAMPEQSANLCFQYNHLQRHKQHHVVLMSKKIARVCPSLALMLDFDFNADAGCWTAPTVDFKTICFAGGV